ncbi:MAG: neuraminidase-like domain-containing protein [Bacteroidia bacterium]|nr:neuraminidase-like domain-containing protein [Bacteroidia bacterium]
MKIIRFEPYNPQIHKAMPSFQLTLHLISAETHQPLANLRVEAWDKDVRHNDLLGSAVTDVSGRCIIQFDERYYADSRDPLPDVFFRVYEGERLRHSTEPSPMKNLDPGEYSFTLEVTSPGQIEEPVRVYGMVRNEQGEALAGLTVQVFDRDMRSEQLLGQTTSDRSGEYEVRYTPTQFRRFEKSSADLGMRILSGDGLEIASVLFNTGDGVPLKKLAYRAADNSVRQVSIWFNAPHSAMINATVTDVGYRGDSEYERYLKELSPLLDGVPMHALQALDIPFLGAETQIDVQRISYLQIAHLWQTQTQLAAEVFYGLFRQNQPTQLAFLLVKDPSEWRKALKQSLTDNVIPRSLEVQLEAILHQLQALLSRYVAGTLEGVETAPLTRLLTTALPDRNLRQQFVEVYAAYDGKDEERFWERLQSQPAFQNGLVEQLRFTFQAKTLTFGHLPLVEALQEERINGNIPSARDLVRLGETGWSSLLDRPINGQPVGIPPGVKGSTPEEQRHTYIQALVKLTEAAFPMQAIVAHLEADDDFEGKQDLQTFLFNNPDFEFGKTSLRRYVLEHGNETLAGVENPEVVAAAQRIFKIAPRYQFMKPLLTGGLDSSLSIQRLGKIKFINDYSESLGGLEVVTNIYHQADAHATYALAVLTKYNRAFDQYRPWVIPAQNPVEYGPTLSPDLELLFGSLTTCRCEHCRSIFSPAAYLVDGLHFLKQNQSGLLEAFTNRRPDIGELELSCANTHTPLPFIHLVNEVLENVITTNNSPGGPSPLLQPFQDAAGNFSWPQTRNTAEELLAAPEYVNPEAYTKLSDSDAVYPLSLPFDLWLETARVYLRHLGSSREEIMGLFQRDGNPADEAIAFESLGVSPVERAIITGNLFIDSARAPLAPYYGYPATLDSASLVRNLTFVATGQPSPIPELLYRLNLQYQDLLDVLDTRFVNPGRTVLLDAPADADCNLGVYGLAKYRSVGSTDKIPLDGSNVDFFERLHRFIRLQRVLGWSVLDTDRAIQTLGEPVADGSDQKRLDDTLLRKLADVISIQREHPRPVEELLGLWAPINTYGENSLYKRLFQNKIIVSPVISDFALRSDGSDLSIVLTDPSGPAPVMNDDRRSLVMAALRMSASDLALLSSSGAANDALTLANLSQLFRYAALARMLRLNMTELLHLRQLTVGDLFTSPSTTKNFIHTVGQVKQSKFSLQQLAYIYLHDPTATAKMEPDDAQMAAIVRTLRSGLQIAPETPETALSPDSQLRMALYAELNLDSTLRVPNLSATQIDTAMGLLQTNWSGRSTEEREEARLQFTTFFGSFLSMAEALPVLLGDSSASEKSSYVLAFLTINHLRRSLTAELAEFLTATRIVEALAFLSAVHENNEANQRQAIQLFGQFLTANQSQENLLGADVSTSQKFTYVLQQIFLFRQRRDLVVQTLADSLDLDITVMRLLLGQLVNAASDPAQKAMVDFLGLASQSASVEADDVPAFVGTLYLRLHKIAIFINGFQLSQEEISFFATYETDDFRPLNFNEIPTTAPVLATTAQTLFRQWMYLYEYQQLRDALSGRKMRLIDVFLLAGDTALPMLSATLIAATGWNPEDIASLTIPNFRNSRKLFRLHRQITLSQKMGVAIDQLGSWATEHPSNAQAQQIRQATKAKYDDLQWLSVVRPLEDVLLEKRRDALVAYLVHQPGVWLSTEKLAQLAALGRKPDANLLYEYFLIDVEMSACQLTSRIRQAIAAVQLFVQRCLMGLEGDAEIRPELASQWETWRKTYRYWEANRKVFLYPENWIEPELRRDKTPFFKDLENALLQNDVTDALVEDAFLSYLQKLNGVAKLDIVGVYAQQEDGLNILHVFGRTIGIPHHYYYRRRVDARFWTPWEKVELDIEGDHLIPVVWNRRLHLFWAIFSEKSESDQMPASEEASRDDRQPRRYWEIQLAFSEYRNGQWSAKSIVEENLQSKDFELESEDNLLDRSQFLFKGFLIGSNSELIIRCFEIRNGLFAFAQADYSFQGCNAVARKIDFPQATPVLNTESADLNFQYLKGAYSLALPNREDATSVFRVNDPERVRTFASNIYEEHHHNNDLIALSTTPGQFKLTPPHQYRKFIPSYHAFFYQDDSRIFFVNKENTPPPESSVGHSLLDFPKLNNAISPDSWGLLPSLRAVPDSIGNVDDVGIFDSFIVGRSASEYDPFAWVSPFGEVSFEAEGRYVFRIFDHPYVCYFIQQLNRYGIVGLLNPAPEGEEQQLRRQLIQETFFNDAYGPNREVVAPARLDPIKEIDFSPGGAYSQYNWELFFHAPLFVATRLMQNQRFAEAQKWFHYLFDPTVGDDPTVDRVQHPDPARFWKIRPFYEAASDRRSAEELMRALNRRDPQLEEQVELWQSNPFDPHVLAGIRVTAYMKTVVMKYLDNLIAWGDHLFQQDTLETLGEATQIYILAANILGPRPEVIPPRGTSAPQTFNQLAPRLDSFSNALVEIEEQLPAFGRLNTRRSSGIPSVLYFCIPANDQLLAYWDTVGDRLFKIRHCMNIEGVVRQLPLFEPPIDPALLVRARALGVDLRNVLAGKTALSPYRFNALLPKAQELCAGVIALGAALLSACEKSDAEALARLRSGHEIRLLEVMKEVRQKQVEEAKEAKMGLERARETIIERRNFYQDIEFMNAAETTSMALSTLASILGMISNGMSVGGASAALVPNITIGVAGWAASPLTIVTTGGEQASNVASSHAKAFETLSGFTNILASLTGTMGSNHRRWEDWKLQERLANKELAQMDKQIAAADIRLQITRNELDNHLLQQKNAREADDYMRSKFTNQELYNWMVSQTSAIYFQSYQLAYEAAVQAEQAYRLERGLEDSKFVRFGQWESLRRGLMSGEQLQLDLRRLEMAYLKENKREFELTKHISLQQLNPLALLYLRETGKCAFSIPEELFDLDFSGHYYRRIRSVSISLPCVAGPYTTINATLRLTKSSIRVQTGGAAYGRTGDDDNRFTDQFSAIQSIATSSAQNDGGLFELSFRDERYLPFEYSGAISEWTLEMMEDASLRQFDYNTIADVIVHLRYTAREDGTLKETARSGLRARLNNLQTSSSETGLFRLFDLRHDFPNEWGQFRRDAGNTFRVTLDKSKFPYWVQAGDINLKALHLSTDGAVNSDRPVIEREEEAINLHMILDQPERKKYEYRRPEEPEEAADLNLDQLPISITFQSVPSKAYLIVTYNLSNRM